MRDTIWLPSIYILETAGVKGEEVPAGHPCDVHSESSYTWGHSLRPFDLQLMTTVSVMSEVREGSLNQITSNSHWKHNEQ